MPRVIISDTSPVRYLVLIGHAELLPALYTDVLIPEAVADELKQPATREPVRRCIAHPPSWLQVVPLTAVPASVSLADLDRGEHDAILLALNLKADLVLMDEREGVEEARRLGLIVNRHARGPRSGCRTGVDRARPCDCQIASDQFPYRSGPARSAAGR